MLILLSQVKEMNEFQVDFLNFNELSLKIVHKLGVSQPKDRIKLTDFITPVEGSSDILRNMDLNIFDSICVMSKHWQDDSASCDSLFAVFYNHELIIIDPHNKSILTKKSFLEEDQSVEYFLSPTHIQANRLLNMKCYSSSNVIICVNNVNNLAMIDYDLARNKLSLVSSSNTQLKFDSNILEINSSSQTDQQQGEEKLLLVHESSKNLLVVYDVNIVKKTSSFRTAARHKITLNEAELNMVGFSSDSNYVYSIENSKILKFYSLRNNMKQIAEMPLYSIPVCCHCTSEFISFSMPDRRIISLLITDPDVPGHLEKIAKLESR